MLTLRLEKKLEQKLSNRAIQLGLSKSELARLSIRKYLDEEIEKNPWELGKELFGKSSSGRDDLSRNTKSQVAEKIRAKRK